MRKKKISLWFGIGLGCIAIGAFFAIPPIVEQLLIGKIAENPAYSVRDVSVSWKGPQTIRGLHVEDEFGSADIDVELSGGLLAVLTQPYQFVVSGDMVIQSTFDSVKGSAGPSGKKENEPAPKTETELFTLPWFTADIELETVTINADEPLVYHDVKGEFIVEPGRVCSFNLDAKTDRGGSIVCFGNAPDLLTEQGELNWNASASMNVSVRDAAIPTIDGQGGWSVTSLDGDITTPKLSETIVVSMVGEFSQYDIPRGIASIKTQFQNTLHSRDPFTFKGKEIVGTIDVQEVPTSILAPLLNKYGVDTARDLGETMEFHLARATEDSLLSASFQSDNVSAEGIVDFEMGILTNVSITADIGTEFVQELSNGELSGDANASIYLNRLVPIGFSHDDKKECEGSLVVKGNLQHVPTETSISYLQSDFSANLNLRKVIISGVITLNESNATYIATFLSTNKNKLHGIDDLWTTIFNQLPRGNGRVAMERVPTSILHYYIPQEQQQFSTLLGEAFSFSATFSQNDIQLGLIGDAVRADGTVSLLGNNIVTEIIDVEIRSVLPAELSSTLLGVRIDNESKIAVDIPRIDIAGNSSFSAIYEIGLQKTFVNGKTTRKIEGDRIGELDVHLAMTGVDTRLLDAILNCSGLLANSLGSPLAVEVIATDILGKPIVKAGGTSPNSAFETSLGFFDGKVFTIPEIPTKVDLQLSPQLTQHFLKDLGPVLSDIRSVKNPIRMTVSNASTTTDGNVASLNADILINIGEVELDSGSATMKLLPMFNTKHVEIVPAFFDPIQIEIRNGIATYKRFNLTLVGKYSIPYSGTIDFVTRQLNIKTAVPLSGLGYSIKELRGLTTDIDVPILITGTIDHPITNVDPNFDLGKLLQNAALGVIGDALGGALDGDGTEKEAPNPLDLLEDLLGGH
ncbi:MAG: hypothetical protein HOC27_02215 [Phycisphaerae bacterium]|nr:hypothetical protein [Phycisphaerae bacterium]